MKFTDNANIPEEYIEQITQLIETNDECNWDIVREIFKGWYNDFNGDVYFYNLMMYYYQHINSINWDCVQNKYGYDRHNLFIKIKNYCNIREL